jgi:FkbM family methyltransferase
MLDRVVLGLLRAAPPAAVDRSRRVPFLAPVLKAGVNLLALPLLGNEVEIADGEAAGLRLRVDRASVMWATGRVELTVQRALAALLVPGSVCFDVGANVGFYTILAARLVGPEGRVVAFEPHPENVKALERNVAANGLANVVVVPKAVSSRSGAARLTHGDRATARLHDGPGHDVRTIALDEFVDEHAALVPAVVKIDVEGHELDVLEGARRTLGSARPALLCEQHGQGAAVVAALERLRYASVPLDGASAATAAHIVATAT